LDWHEFQRLQHRREFLRCVAGGVGAWALGDLLSADRLTAASVDANPLAPKAPHFAPKAKHIVYMFMEGGPSPGLARKFHNDSAARRDKPASTSLRSPTVLTVLFKYASAR